MRVLESVKKSSEDLVATATANGAGESAASAALAIALAELCNEQEAASLLNVAYNAKRRAA